MARWVSCGPAAMPRPARRRCGARPRHSARTVAPPCARISMRGCRTARWARGWRKPTAASPTRLSDPRPDTVNQSPPPLVSVVLASFVRPQFLVASIESVLAQSMSDFELIVADDGSGERTRALLRSFERDPRVRLLWLEHRGVPAAVRNAAIGVARGRYVAFQ